MKCFKVSWWRRLSIISLYQPTNLYTGPNSKQWQMTKLMLIKEQKFFLGLIENIVGKGENAGYQHFLLFL